MNHERKSEGDMADLESIERRLERIEQRMNEVVSASAAGIDEKPKRVRRGSAHVFWGIFIIAIGLIWLGQTLGVKWIESVRIWPIALIAFGLFLIFVGRGR